MRAYRALSKRSLRVAVLVVFLVVPVVGCYESPTAPCHHCEPIEWDDDYTRRVQREFTVDDGAGILVDDFVGRVTYRVGVDERVRVVATLRARRYSDLDHIALSMVSHSGGVDVRAQNPAHLKHVAVDLEITAPAGAVPSIAVGTGDIDYRGRPTGAYRFTTGVGSIRVRLPADVSLTVELSVGVGSIFLGFPVDGMVSNPPGYVRGRIGDGGDGRLDACAAVGNITLSEW